jgi:multidrug efflux pump subunit AcrA (membrane-fusion protein)
VDIKREPKKNTKKYILYGVGLAGVVAVTVALASLKPAAQTVAREVLIIDEVKQGPMIRDVSAPGTLEPEYERIIAAVNAGRVENLPIRPGAKVEPGTVIVELVDPNMELQVLQFQQTLAQAISAQASLRTALNQQQSAQEATLAAVRTQYRAAVRAAAVADSLGKDKLFSKNDVDAAHDALTELKTRLDLETQRLDEIKRSAVEQLKLNEEQVANARSIFEEQKKRAANMRVTAPEAGVLQTLGNPQLQYGQWVQPGVELARVAQPGKLKAVLRVPDAQAKDIALGQSVTIDLHNNSTVKGRVMRYDPAANGGNVTVEVQITDPIPPGVRSQQTVDGRIEIENLANVLHVGRPSYGSAPGNVGLWVLTPDGKEATLVPVELGSASVSQVQIKKGLTVGQKVIISDMSQFDNTNRVRIK